MTLENEMSEFKKKRLEEKFLKDIESNIRKHGFTVVTTCTEDQKFLISYTLGLAEKGLNELCISMPYEFSESAANIIMHTASLIQSGKLKLEDRATYGQPNEYSQPKIRLHRVDDPATIQDHVSPWVIRRYGEKCKNRGPLVIYQIECGDNLARFGGDEGFVPMMAFVALSDSLEAIYKQYQ